MTKQVQRRRGTAAQHTSFTGAEGEISVNTTNKSVHVHDGVTAGGVEAARADLDNVTGADILSAAGVTATAAELNYVDGVTSSIQTQIDAKAPINGATFTGTTTIATADINGGAIDGVTIGGASAGAITGTTITGSTLVSTGNITVSGTIDGRDVAADGTKLDGIEAGADVTDTTNVTAAGALMTTGGTMTGDLSFSGADATFGDSDKAIFGAGSDLQIYHDGSNSWIRDVGTGDLVITTDGAGMQFKSNGSSEQMLRLYQNGPVYLYYDNALKLATTSTGVDVTGTITSDGLTVADGTSGQINVHSTSYNIQGGSAYGDMRFNAPRFRFYEDGTTLRMSIDNGDISFYEDTGTTPKFFWDASAESLGIGTSSPNFTLEAKSSGGTTIAATTTGATSLFRGFAVTDGAIEYASLKQKFDDGELRLTAGLSGWGGFTTFHTNGSERMRIDSSGNVGIGTSSPATLLQVTSTGTGAEDIVRVNSGGGGSFVIRCEDLAASNPTWTLRTFANEPMAFAIATTEAMRIDSSGVVTIQEGAVTLNGNTINAIEVTIADDAAAALTFFNRGGGLLWVLCEGGGTYPQVNNYSGFVTVDFGSSPGYQTPIFAGSSFAMNTSGALTGTTGTNGFVTVGVAGTADTLYVENRTGSSKHFQITLL